MDRRNEIRLLWLSRIRWAALAAYFIVSAFAVFFFEVDIPLVPIGLILLLGAVSNVLLARMPLRLSAMSDSLAGAMISLDVLLLTAILYFCGGYTNPFCMMFLAHVALAAFFLNARWTWGVFGIASAAFIFLFFFHVPVSQFSMHMHHGMDSGFSLHLHGMFIAYFVIGLILAAFLTRMSGEIDTQAREIDELRSREQLERNLRGLATLTAGAAHELSTPLGTLTLIGEELSRALKGKPEFNDDIVMMQEQLQRCASILQRMRGQSAELQGEAPVTVSIESVLRGVVEGVSSPSALGIRCDIAASRQLYTLQDSLLSSLRALVNNAFQASSYTGTVDLEVTEEGENVVFLVRDSGVGMSEEVVSRLGEPFFTTKEPGQGMGLGIFLVKLFVAQVNGSFSISSRLGEGTEVCMTIPRSFRV
jgi:two-component system sensor histidine kinase RegB